MEGSLVLYYGSQGLPLSSNFVVDSFHAYKQAIPSVRE
jgi:hypothetical protein